jgi:hypothetical protein
MKKFYRQGLKYETIQFEQPKYVLTKEMILEYKKEQRNKPALEDIVSGELKYQIEEWN